MKKRWIALTTTVICLFLLFSLSVTAEKGISVGGFSFEEITDIAELVVGQETVDEIQDLAEDTGLSDVVENIEETDWEGILDEYGIPLDKRGTADYLDGNVLVVSIFLNDDNWRWNKDDPQDMARYNLTCSNLQVSCNWIEEQGRRYGKDIHFIYDWQQNPDLCYETAFSGDTITGLMDGTNDTDRSMREYISEHIPYMDLRKKYDAENVLFMVYVDCFSDNGDMRACCYSIDAMRNHTVHETDLWDIGTSVYEYITGKGSGEYDICYFGMNIYGWNTEPNCFAHEMLHCFGAADLYRVSKHGENYHLTEEFVSYVDANYNNEIMYNTWRYDSYGNLYCEYDGVSCQLSDMTAYYIGWTNDWDGVARWGIDQSEYI